MAQQQQSHPEPLPDAFETAAADAQFHRAFERVHAVVRNVPPDDLEPINLKVPAVVTAVLGAIPELLGLRAALVEVPTFDAAQLDQLKDYALALGHTYSEQRSASAPIGSVLAQVQRLRDIRTQLHLDAAPLVSRGLLDGERVRRLRGGASHRIVVFDVLGLVQLFLERWDTLGGNTAVRREELEAARTGANALMSALAKRQRPAPPRSLVTTLHRQAYTLLVRAYAEVRRAVLFLRRAAGDGDSFAPSLFKGRGKRAAAPGKIPPPENATPTLGSAVIHVQGEARARKNAARRRFLRNSFRKGAEPASKRRAVRFDLKESQNMTTQNNSENVNLVEHQPGAEDAQQFHLGFTRVEAIVRAVPVDNLEPIHLDVTATVATVLGAYPEIVNLRPSLAGLSTFDISQLDQLQDYALALGHAHGEYRVANGVVDNVGSLAAECLEIRERFQADANALVARKLLQEVQVAKLRGGNGYRMIAFDVVGLVNLFLANWETIQGKSGLEREELEQARLKANQLVAAVGRREQSNPGVNPNALLRQQAYTLLLRAYTDIREAIAFLRRAVGDVDDIAPSLFAGRTRRSGSEDVATPAAAPATTPQVSTTPDPAPTDLDVPVGFPGSSPFTAS